MVDVQLLALAAWLVAFAGVAVALLVNAPLGVGMVACGAVMFTLAMALR